MQKELALNDIRINGGTQQRPIDDAVVLRYKALLLDGAQFPPVEVMFDGKDYWLVDGFHRYWSHGKAGKKYISAIVTEGTKRDAVWKSFSANAKHGLPRQPGTVKDMLFDKIFPDVEWEKQTDEELGKHIGGCSTRTIARYRAEYNKPPAERKPATAKPQTEPKEEVVKDAVGKIVPAHLVEVFYRADEIRVYIRQMNQMFKDIKEAQSKNDPLWVNCKLDSLKADVGNLRRNLRFALPYAVCCYCGGDINNKECTGCNSMGFLNELSYKAAPADMKED